MKTPDEWLEIIFDTEVTTKTFREQIIEIQKDAYEQALKDVAEGKVKA